MTIDNNRVVAEWKETKYIVVSSSFFMIPAVYGFYNNLYVLPLILFITSLVSMNFWRDAKYSWRRIIDRIVAKITFIVCYYHSIKYASMRLIFFLQYAGLFTFVYYYYMSNKYHGAPGWYKYHVKFHILCVFTQLMIVQCVADHKRIENYDIKYI